MPPKAVYNPRCLEAVRYLSDGFSVCIRTRHGFLCTEGSSSSQGLTLGKDRAHGLAFVRDWSG